MKDSDNRVESDMEGVSPIKHDVTWEESKLVKQILCLDIVSRGQFVCFTQLSLSWNNIIHVAGYCSIVLAIVYRPWRISAKSNN